MNTTKNLQDTDILSENILNKENYSNEDLANELMQGTPLYLIKTNEDGTKWVLSFGKYALKEGNSKAELKEYVENNMLNVITDMIICTIEANKNMTNNLKKTTVYNM